jgi:SPX domain protein involved in polyphosphate accumulation
MSLLPKNNTGIPVDREQLNEDPVQSLEGAVPPQNPEDYRFERKFVTASLSSDEVKLILKTHPALFRSAYPFRQVNNIYFDSPGLDTYVENIDGHSNRHKVRLRWYGPLMERAQNPRLEIKIKSGFLGTKLNFDIESFSLQNGLSSSFIKTLSNTSKIPHLLYESLSTYRPSVANRYLRHYFLSADRRFRITVDTKIVYYRISPHEKLFTVGYHDTANVIIEIKYEFKDADDADRISNSLPFRLIKNSKYISGIDRIFS